VLKTLFAEERRRGGLDVDAATPSTITAHAPGYIDREQELIVGLQTDAPLRRAIMPAGGLRMVETALQAYGFASDPQVHRIFTSGELRVRPSPLRPPQFAGEVLRRCKDLGLHTALDTSGFLGVRADEALLDATDLVLLDVKSWDPATYRQLTRTGRIAPTLRFGPALPGKAVVTLVAHHGDEAVAGEGLAAGAGRRVLGSGRCCQWRTAMMRVWRLSCGWSGP
jgi:hypothetical protein